MFKKNTVINIFLVAFIVLIWSAIIFSTFILWILSDVFRFFGNGVLVYSFALVYICALVLPFVFRKRISEYLSLPLSLVFSSVVSVIITGLMLAFSSAYISEFTPEKWRDNEKLRICMLDDLEQKYEIVGKTEKEIRSILGNPEYIYPSDAQQTIYEYYIGDSIIDPYGFVIEFENDVAVNTKLVEH